MSAARKPSRKLVSTGKKMIKETIKKGGAQSDIEEITGIDDGNSAKVANLAGDRLKSIVERIERLEEERKALSSDVKDIFQEAKSAGFDTRVLRKLLAIRKQEPAQIEEEETLLDVYRRALGM